MTRFLADNSGNGIALPLIEQNFDFVQLEIYTEKGFSWYSLPSNIPDKAKRMTTKEYHLLCRHVFPVKISGGDILHYRVDRASHMVP